MYGYQANQNRTARLYHHDQVCECWGKSLWSNVYKYSLISHFNSSFLISFDFGFYFNSNLRLQKQTNLLLLLLLLYLFFHLPKCNSQESSSSSSLPSSLLWQSPADLAVLRVAPTPHHRSKDASRTRPWHAAIPKEWVALLVLVVCLVALVSVRSYMGPVLAWRGGRCEANEIGVE